MIPLLLIFCSTLAASEEVDWIGRMQAVSALNDANFSIQTADEVIQRFPNDPKSVEWAVRLYANAGDEVRMMQTYKKYTSLNSELDRDLLEEMSWGVIRKGAKSQAPFTRLISLIAAAMANDSRGVEILCRGLKDTHRVVRLLSAEFASHFRDAPLQEAVARRLKDEIDFKVRLSLIKATGPMQIKSNEPLLLALLYDERSRAEEKVAAISSLVALKEEVDRKEIEPLVKSPRAGLRALACELIRFNGRKEDKDLLFGMLDDTHCDVCAASLEAIGLLRIDDLDKNRLIELASHNNPEVAVRAAWVLTLIDPHLGQKYYEPYIYSNSSYERLLASGFLALNGKYGFPLTLTALKRSTDPFVRLNMAEVLIQQRIEPNRGVVAIREVLRTTPERWSKHSSGAASWIGPDTGDEEVDLPNMKEAVNQIARLEMINLLAIEQDPSALSAMEGFLTERSWGIAGAAASLLLTEGQSEAVDLVKGLLAHANGKIRLQAALVLAMWGNESAALKTLEELYPSASREQKEQILEALGKIGDSQSLPFLIERLNEPHQVLRMIASAAILQTLYH
ncbi:MAG: HEAT repeat domain-containing protein [Parachlamydiaceae bacterium]